MADDDGGGWAFTTAIVAVLGPVTWVALHMVLRLVNACVVLEEGVLYVRNALRRWTSSIDVDAITGVHLVTVKVSSDQVRPNRVVITSDGGDRSSSTVASGRARTSRSPSPNP